MKKQIHILQGIIILTFIFIATLLIVEFVYKIMHEKMDTSYMWNINLTNPRITEGSEDAQLNLDNKQISLDLTLQNENDFYELFLDIENTGTLSAKLEDIIFTVDNEKEILKYSLSYEDNSEIKIGDIIESNNKSTIKIRIEYPPQQEKTYEALKLSLNLNIKYSAIY